MAARVTHRPKRSGGTLGSHVEGNAPRDVHVLSPDDPGKAPAGEFFFRRERIMGPAPELEIVERPRAAERMGVTMVDLEPERFATSFPTVVAVGASRGVAIKHGAPHGCRDVTRH